MIKLHIAINDYFIWVEIKYGTQEMMVKIAYNFGTTYCAHVYRTKRETDKAGPVSFVIRI